MLKSRLGRSAPLPPVKLRDTLFGDRPIDAWPGVAANAEGFPWDAFALARTHLANGDHESAVSAWRTILNQHGLEPRHYLQAWHFLRQIGHQPSPDVAR